LPDPPQESKNPWVRVFWIVFGLAVGLIVLSYLAIQTLGPSS
jgi:hypothetical protein